MSRILTSCSVISLSHSCLRWNNRNLKTLKLMRLTDEKTWTWKGCWEKLLNMRWAFHRSVNCCANATQLDFGTTTDRYRRYTDYHKRSHGCSTAGILSFSSRLLGFITVISHPTAVARLGFNPRLSVCLSAFPHDISKTDAARIIKFDIEMFHGRSWKVETGLFWRLIVKDQGHESQKHCGRGSLHSCECWLLPVRHCRVLLLV